MLIALSPFLAPYSSSFRSRAALQVEILALRRQIGVLRRSAKKRPKLTVADRFLWVWLSARPRRTGDRRCVIVKPETVIAWHRKGFRAVSGPGKFGTEPLEGLACRAKSGT